MRSEALELLRCSRCRHYPLTLETRVQADQEVREGELRCANCEERFLIAGGVVEMLRAPSQQAEEELESIDKWLPLVNEVTPLNDDWLIGLPRTFHKGAETDIAVNLTHFLELVDARPGQRVLEVGAGVTWLSNLLARRGCSVVATDITRRLYVGLDSADVLMRHFGTVYDRVTADMNDVPCVDGAFDVVVANAVFHHSEDLTETFREMWRVLRPGGRMVFLEPVVGPLNLAGKRFLSRLHEDGLGDQAYPIWSYTRAARRAGFAPHSFIAPSVEHHLRHLRDDPDYLGNRTLKYRLARSVPRAFQVPVLAVLARRALYPAALYLFGLTCIFVGHRLDPWARQGRARAPAIQSAQVDR
ncbi:MAG: hypothetical protein A2148_12385 [Chloroflexi bacterium RBG_16_68_14]|nr:MAG: hypothetical protein A2148_12385 [Chloroflexi bacterium RBG_16_68_14]